MDLNFWNKYSVNLLHAFLSAVLFNNFIKLFLTGNRRRNVNTQNDMEYDSDSQEEGDPFSADESSSASEVFEGGDSDSDYMEEPSFDDVEDKEEVKIMFKEAKKFLRKKRKDWRASIFQEKFSRYPKSHVPWNFIVIFLVQIICVMYKSLFYFSYDIG